MVVAAYPWSVNRLSAASRRASCATRARSRRRLESYARRALTGEVFGSTIHSSLLDRKLRTMDAPLSIVERLRVATNARDLDALVDCFADDYRNETPAHPRRSFEGRSQVRANWTQTFAAVPDVTAVITASVVTGDVVWSEWEMK